MNRIDSKLTSVAATTIAIRFTKVRRIFFGEENQRPLFMCSQNIPLKPNVNQLAKRAVCYCC